MKFCCGCKEVGWSGSVLAQIGYKYSSDPQKYEEDSSESTPLLATNGSILSTFKGASLIEPSVLQQQQQQTAEQNAERKTLSATKLCRLDNNGVNLLLVIFTDLNPGFFLVCMCVAPFRIQNCNRAKVPHSATV